MPTYYLSPTGSDDADGLSELNPWCSLTKLSYFPAQPGDVFRLRGGDVFPSLINWFWKGIQDVAIRSYGTGRPTIASPENANALLYAGPGGITVEGINFRGNCPTPGYGGLDFRMDAGPCSGIRLLDLDVSGYSMAGIQLTGEWDRSITDTRIERCRLHHNANGLYAGGVDGLTVSDTVANDNDWLGNDPGVTAGYGLAINGSHKVLLERCDFDRNGRHTTTAGGHGGVILSGCTEGVIRYCRARDNGDPLAQDGGGFYLYGCHDSLLEYSLSERNPGGVVLMHDIYTRPAERCVVRHHTSTNDIAGLNLVGTVLDSHVLHSDFTTHSRDGVYRKAFDISNPPEESSYTKRVRVWGNKFRAEGGAPLLEAVLGLAGVDGLEANGWDSDDPKFVVRGVNYLTIDTAVAAGVGV